MITEKNLHRLVVAIYQQDDLNGCRIVLHQNGHFRVLHSGIHVTLNYGRVMVVIEEAAVPKAALISSASVKPIVLNRSRLGAELLGTGLTMLFTTLSFAGVAASVATELPSGGLSTALLLVSCAGLASSSLQMGNCLQRLGQIACHPNSNTLQQLDNNQFYTRMFTLIDAVGIFSSGYQITASGLGVVKLLIDRRLLCNEQGALLTVQAFISLRMPERKLALQKALQQASKTPQLRLEIEQALRDVAAQRKDRLGGRDIANHFSGHGVPNADRVRTVHAMLSARSAERLSKLHAAIFQESRQIVSGSTSIAVSGTNPNVTGAASGSVYTTMMFFIDPQTFRDF